MVFSGLNDLIGRQCRQEGYEELQRELDIEKADEFINGPLIIDVMAWDGPIVEYNSQEEDRQEGRPYFQTYPYPHGRTEGEFPYAVKCPWHQWTSHPGLRFGNTVEQCELANIFFTLDGYYEYLLEVGEVMVLDEYPGGHRKKRITLHAE